MSQRSMGAWARRWLGVLALGLANAASAQLTFNHIVVFGGSVSDPGNAFALLTHPVAGLSYTGNVSQNVPPYDALDETLVPDAPYAKGGHHFSNGATWIEQFALGRGFAGDVGPAFQGNGMARNYAVGGARATDYPNRVNLPQQVQAFLSDVGQAAPANSLYVVDIGGNDIRDALVQFLVVLNSTGDPNQAAAAANTVIAGALGGIADNIQTLYGAGARKFLVLTAPRIDLVPSVQALGTGAITVAAGMTDGFNQGLVADVLTPLSGLPGIQIARLDLAAQMAAIIGAPAGYGLTNVTTPCLTPNLPPYTCQQPDAYFFWDGLHPTKAVHGIIAQQAADALGRYPNP
jgi:phospholipase/lecithinase/hemolysin